MITSFALAASLAVASLAQPAHIGMDRAVEIARENGIARVTDVDTEDYGWEIEGCTADGFEIEVEIERSGRVRDIDRDDDRCDPDRWERRS